ncbi:discs large 1-like protein isoform X16 [Vespula maculifrons]|uniref:Discs large 1-like protein isoform X16 n=1 Tax=Vespula maculifrons TaxID=7453 RepID=A0ABD2CXF6_VESMC
MIDWVSIVHHSRRRFSDYMYVVPARVKKQRRAKQRRYSLKNSIEHRAYVAHNDDLDEYHCDDFCGCCSWNHKTRYNAGGVEEQLPPPPSPPQVKEGSQLDGVPRPNSVERILHPDATTQHILTTHETLNKVGSSSVYMRLSIKQRRETNGIVTTIKKISTISIRIAVPNTRGQNSSAATLQLGEHELHTVHRERFSRSSAPTVETKFALFHIRIGVSNTFNEEPIEIVSSSVFSLHS